MFASQARIAYRRLLKAQRKRFTGDPQIIVAAWKQTRTEFEQNRSLDNEKKIQKKLKHAAEVEEIIRRYIVQGNLSKDKESTYEIAFTKEHALRDAHPILIKSTLNKDKKQ